MPIVEPPNVLAGITFVHSINRAEKGIDSQGPYWVVEYQITDWSLSDQFVNALMGYSSYNGTVAVNTGPHRHPLSPNLACQEARVVGRGRPLINGSGYGYPSYQDGARIEAVYRAPVTSGNGGGGIIQPSDDPGWLHQIDPENPLLWCTQELDFAVETLTVENSNYVWDMPGDPFDGMAVGSAVQIDVSITTMVLTYHQLPYLPVTKLRAARGKVNSLPFMGNAAEMVLFQGAKTTREWTSDGRVAQRVQLTFVERDYSWNRLLMPNKFPGDSNAYGLIKTTTNKRRYEAYDLRQLVYL